MPDFAARGQGRHDLHARGAIAHNGHPLAVQWHGVIKARTVNGLPFKLLQPLDLGVVGVVQHAGGGHHADSLIAFALLIRELPGLAQPLGAADLAVEAHRFGQAVFFKYRFKILLNLGTGRQYPRPFRIGLK